MTEYTAGAIASLLANNSGKTLDNSTNKVLKSKIKKKLKNSDLILNKNVETPNIPVGIEQITPKLKKLDEPKIVEQEPSKKQKAKKRIAENQECEDRTIFIGNVPFQTNNRKIKKLFTKFGEIEAVYQRSLLQKNQKLTLQMLKTDKQIEKNLNSTNFFVRFKDAESANFAVDMNGYLFEGHTLRVTLSAKKELDKSKTVFVGNLPFIVEEQQILEFFSKCGKVDTVRVTHDKITGKGRGFAYVAFEEPSSVYLALKLNETEFRKRKIRVSKIIKKKKLEKQKANQKRTKNNKLLDKISKFSTLKGHKTEETSTKNKMKKIPRSVQKMIRKKRNQKTKSIMS